ncbi:amino acid permease [Sneathiella sp. P13V-1]|uniref:APC family permease n=1 Tax=Sneathiella sp. P13V-1 TaxID=2697366 RepID=UPI00187BBDB0|nr:amino acid permease [Sneathiella sp. P13V-1]MBE7635224.1 amino acid permease [Sneathiella sp. P13V-1]
MTTETKLKRRLNLPLLILYGLGVTIGAGIYVLVGAAAGKAGLYAPISFVLAAVVVSFTGFSYAELSTRYPVSAGEAAYVKKGFNSSTLSLAVGIMVIASGVVSSAAVAIGAAAYIHELLAISQNIILFVVIVIVGLVAAWGILESVSFAALFTIVEILGLLLVIGYAFYSFPEEAIQFQKTLPPFDAAVWTGIFSAGLLAFFAFIGFEDIVNVAEEVKNPGANMPKGIIWTLIVATLIYFVVVSVVVLTVPLEDLIASDAPLSLVFRDAGFATEGLFILIAIIATVNGILIQVIMASRVLYGLAAQGNLPEQFSNVNEITQTPLVATATIIGLIMFLAYFMPISSLAETTSSIVLSVFAIVNIALILIKKKGDEPGTPYYKVGVWVPYIGFISSTALLISGFLT